MRLIPCLMLFAALPAAAQNVRLADRTAILFNLGGIMTSTPSALDGVGVGGRLFLDDGMAIRGAVGLNIASSTEETSAGNFSQDEENSSSTYALEGGVEIVLMRAKAAYLYTGGLLQLGYTSADPDGDDNNQDGFGVTLAGLLGANYFLMDGLSIGAEYRLGLAYASNTREQGEDAKVESSSTVFGTGTFGFHLGFWF